MEESYHSLFIVLQHPLLITAPQNSNGLQTVMRQESMVQIRLLNTHIYDLLSI